jgi:hypothetical protein
VPPLSRGELNDSQNIKMKIIKATLAELEQTAKLFDDYRVFYDQEPDIEGALKFINERMKNNESVIYIALDDNNEGMCFTQLYHSFTSFGMKKMWILNDLYFDIIHRHKKVAEGLIERAKNIAGKQALPEWCLKHRMRITQHRNYITKPGGSRTICTRIFSGKLIR